MARALDGRAGRRRRPLPAARQGRHRRRAAAPPPRPRASCCDAAGALFLLNDRPDLAAAGGADGVHVGQDDMPVDRARKLVGDDALVGLSTHSLQQAQAGCRSGADYIARRPRPRHADQGGPAGDRRRADRATPPRTCRSRGSRSAASTPAPSARWSRRARGGSSSCARSPSADDPEAAARALRAATNGARVGRRSRKRAPRRAPVAPPPREARRRSHAPRLRARRGAQRRGPRPARAARARRAPARRSTSRPRSPRCSRSPTSSRWARARRRGQEPGAFGVLLFARSCCRRLGDVERRYWAVLGFEALLAITLCIARCRCSSPRTWPPSSCASPSSVRSAGCSGSSSA